MILSDTSIAQYIENELISMKPFFDPKQLRPVGIRVHLNHDILIPTPNQTIDLTNSKVKAPVYQKVDLKTQPLVLNPRSFVLGSTIESFKVDSTLICRLDGRSTLARLGLIVHCTATVIDSIHTEYRSVVLEIANLGNSTVIIPNEYPIGMLTFEKTSSPMSGFSVQNQYQGQMGTTSPNLDFSTSSYSL